MLVQVMTAVDDVAGTDAHHRFAVEDYVGSAMTTMRRHENVVTLAVGAPGE